jgi:hypothetical protein
MLTYCFVSLALFIIDGLSLAMFEALRKLRDAVAPDSGNLGGNTSNNTESTEPDLDELWRTYKSGETNIVEMFHKVNNGNAILKREDFIRLHAKMEMEKDTELVYRLASIVLEKSAAIDNHVDALPGMHRTRTEQMKRIEELLVLNQSVVEGLDGAYAVARERRDACRKFVREATCQALGIEEQQDK